MLAPGGPDSVRRIRMGWHQLNEKPRLTVAFDVDGVISPLPFDERESESYIDIPRAFNSRVTVEVAELLRRLSDSPQVELLWHTSWRENAIVFAEKLEFEPPQQFATEEEFRSPEGWWKELAVRRWLADGDNAHRRLLWVDDDLFDSVALGDVAHSLLEDERLSHLCPIIGTGGLSSVDVEAVEHWLQGERVAPIVTEGAQNELPTIAGSFLVAALPGVGESLLLELSEEGVWLLWGDDVAVAPDELRESAWLSLPAHFKPELSRFARRF